MSLADCRVIQCALLRKGLQHPEKQEAREALEKRITNCSFYIVRVMQVCAEPKGKFLGPFCVKITFVH